MFLKNIVRARTLFCSRKSRLNLNNLRNMCILFLHVGRDDIDSDYGLILASNRDEFYDRPAQNMAPWSEDPNVVGGRDLESGCDGGTWLAMSPLRKRVGVLLNLPNVKNPEARTRGRIVADFVKSEIQTSEYIESEKNYLKECNDFVFVTVELGRNQVVQTYSNATGKLDTWTDTCLGFSNSLPDQPLRKVEAGKQKLRDICSRLNRVSMRNQLIDELLQLLKSTEQHLPDPELESRRPNMYKALSSIFVNLPEGRYGTRTHTIILVTKTGHMDVIEISLQTPIDLSDLKWNRSEFQLNISCGDVRANI